jgi:hypothetical protein
MRLLVSVRSAEEARAALAGGADIVDAKEPSRGSLGPVDAATLREIAAALPARVPLSLALGDFDRAEAAAAAVAGVPRLPSRALPLYLKLGFAGAALPMLRPILEAALGAAQTRADGTGIVAVAYADHEEARAPRPAVVVDLAGRLGAEGVLLDTRGKDGHDLLHWMPLDRLRAWVADARSVGLLTALAGSLARATLPLVAGCGADIVGVRGAACRGGREGAVTADLVGAIRQGLDRAEAQVSGHSAR